MFRMGEEIRSLGVQVQQVNVRPLLQSPTQVTLLQLRCKDLAWTVRVRLRPYVQNVICDIIRDTTAGAVQASIRLLVGQALPCRKSRRSCIKNAIANVAAGMVSSGFA